MRSTVRLLALGLVSAFAVGCSADSGEGDSAESASSVTSYRTIWKDLRELDGSGWTKLMGEVASDKIQESVGGDLASASWDVKAASTGANVKASSLPGMSVYDLDTISTGLLQRFGDADLPARVNKIRKDNVDGGYYLDAVTTGGLKLAKSWGIDGPDAGDFKASISFGFDSGVDVTSRVVVHSPKDKIGDEAKAWLTSLLSERDYLFSKSDAAVDEMKPGEMWAMRGKGRLGGHLGVGVPIVTSGAFSVVFNAGISANLEGLVDVQVIKLDGGQVVVDLGIQDGAVGRWSAGVGGSFGVPDICKDSETGKNGDCLPTLGSGAAKVDLKTVVPNLARDLLNDYVGFRVETGGSKGSQRLSVLRLRFDFAAASGEAAKEARAAFARAIRFDARHAQTLYHQQIGAAKPTVTVEADLFRSMSTSTRYTDFDAFGFSVYESRDDAREGTMTLRTPSDTKVVSYSMRNKRAGWFETRHGFSRMALAATSAKEGAQANLVLNIATSDKHLDERGLLTENADAVLLATGGRAVSDALDAFGNPLQARMKTCLADDACVLRELGGPSADAARAAFEGRRDAEIASALRGMPRELAGRADYVALVEEAARMRLSAQALAFSGDQMEGPAMDFTFGLRVDDRGLDELLNPSRVEDFKARAYDYLVTATSLNRTYMAPAGGITKADLMKRLQGQAVSGQLDDPKWPTYAKLVDDLAKVYVESAKRYQKVRAAEKGAREAMRRFEGRFVPVFVGLDLDTVKGAGKRADAQRSFASLAHQSAEAAASLVDALYDEAGGELHRTTHLWPEHLVGYTIAQLVSPANRETTIDLRITNKLAPRFAAAGLGRWATAKPIVAGQVTKVSFGPLDLEAAALKD